MIAVFIGPMIPKPNPIRSLEINSTVKPSKKNGSSPHTHMILYVPFFVPFFTVIFPDLLTVRFLLPLFFLKVTAPCAFLMVNAFAFFIVCFFFAVFAAFTEGFFALAVRVFSFLECFSMVLSSPSVTPSTSISLLHNS